MGSFIALDKLLLFLGIFFAVSLIVITAIMLDLWDGVYTAKKTNQRVHSHKLRVTIAKMSEYWRFLLIGFLVDCLGVFFDFYFLPFVAVLFGAGLIIVEIKSMFEHANRRKSHVVDVPKICNDIISAVDTKDAMRILDMLETSKMTSPHH